MLSISFAFAAGITLALQNSLSGMMTPYTGAMGASLVGFIVQLILLVLYHLVREHKLPAIGPTPPVYYSGGLLAGVLVACNGYCVSVLGSSVMACCSVVGQILMSALVDHFALFGKERNRFSIRRLPGFTLMVLGVLLINLIGGSGVGEAKLVYLLVALATGFCSVFVRSMNFKVSNLLGSTIAGSTVNSIGGLISAFVLFFALSGFKPDLATFASVPIPCYFAGCFGVLCMLFNIAAYKKSNVFYATIFMLVGQVATSITMDILIFHSLSMGKCIGIAVVVAGIMLDKFLDRGR